MSPVVFAEREVIAVRPDAMASRFLTMAHFTGQQLDAFLGLLASGHVDKNSEHDPVDDAFIAALPARGNPTHLFSHQDPEIDFVSTLDCPGRGKRGLYAIAVGGMDVR
jgi:hypothetical protein